MDSGCWKSSLAGALAFVGTFCAWIDGSMFAQDGAPAPPVLKPSRNVPSLQVADGLKLDLLLQEPVVANPLYLNFDERGRLWVVEYRQYPWPAGLKLVSRDNVWRNVYDPPFPPPPPHAADSPFRGRDRISIHQDRDGDGTFEHHHVFLEGLNLATAALVGRGGVFVMNPPYLLFYSDRDQDDLPDSLTPRILLSGFGIEDTHSIANSLRWGPDGWIYGAEGSTVSAAVVRHGEDNQPIPGEKPIHSMGQNIWRYHPEQHRYEIFAEGGGNAFGVEFDGEGRVYSGHNGGDTRGFHYVQGGYYLKNFGKHGLHTNPFVFGHYGAMKHSSVERFTHTFEIFEGDGLPSNFRGKLFSISPILHYVMASEIFPDGSTRQTRDLGPVVVPGSAERDDWFIPVDIQTGPDGALYVADWYASQASHLKGSVGETNPELGRVYRLRSANSEPAYPRLDLRKWTSERLVREGLGHPNRWYRETALRLLGDRRDDAVVPLLQDRAVDPHNLQALWALWGLHLSGGFTPEIAEKLWEHPDPHVRSWSVRLLTELSGVPDETWRRIGQLAAAEPDVEVRLQLANSARKIPTALALQVLGSLIRRDIDAEDPMIPRATWWGVETHAHEREALLTWLQQPELWEAKLAAASQLQENLMCRYGLQGTQADLQACARLMQLAPTSDARKRLAGGFSRAFEGRAIPPLPDELIAALSQADPKFAAILGVRRHDPAAIAAVLAEVAAPDLPLETRVQYIRALGDVVADPSRVVPGLISLLREPGDEELTIAVLGALQKYGHPEIGEAIVTCFPRLAPAAQASAQAVLASRSTWAKQLMAAVEANSVAPASLSQDTVARMRWHPDPDLVAQVAKWFPVAQEHPDALDQRTEYVEQIARSGQGSPLEGQNLFHQEASCGKCHRMFGRGGEVGPDLTSYNRSNLRLLLLAVVNPSAEIREGYENLTVFTDDGRVVTGFVVDENDHILVLRTVDGQNQSIDKSTIEEQRPNKASLMPTGLLDSLTDSQLRDLCAFLTSTTPPN